MPESISIYSDFFPTIVNNLLSNGNVGLMLLDVSEFGLIEEVYGSQIYALVRSRLFNTIVEQAGIEFRKEDIVALEQPEGLRILLFLGPKRQHHEAITHQDVDSVRVRMSKSLIPALMRAAFPYLKKSPRIDIGFALGIHNPLKNPHHIILRTIREASSRALWQRGTNELHEIQKLKELIMNRQVATFYQPIVALRGGQPIGFEALSRGRGDSGFQSADDMFDTAIRHHLLVELDRICRNQALVRANRLPAGVKVFINTLPVTIRDPEFQGQSLVKLLEPANITPDRIVLEITEKLLIENLSLFQESMSYFLTLGMSLAVDDVGAGYSGLETISKLNPSYLKLDASLIRDLHARTVNREMIKAILALGHGIGAKIVAEGIETEAELKTLQDIGIDYGQGYLLGRPAAVS